METDSDPGPRLTWTGLIIGAVVVAAIGWLVWINTPRPVRADLGLVPVTDKFSYARWDSEVLVAKGAAGRPELSVTETVVARFPDHDQNKGIVRGIPARWSHTVEGISVTNADGDDVPFQRHYDSAANMVYILTGTDTYVQGEQTYVISYRTDDGVVADSDRGIQELYWNLLPLDSAQEIEQFSATVRIAPELTGALTGRNACYQGRFGSTDTCELQVTTEDGATVYTYESGHRDAGDGVTVAAGFAASTFVGVPVTNMMEPPSMLQAWYSTGTVGAVTAGLGLVALWAGRRVHQRFTARVIAADPRPSKLPPMPQSGVSANLPPPVAVALLRADRMQRDKKPRDGSAIAGRAEIVHLAVQGAIRFEGHPSRGRMSVRLLDRELARHAIDQRMLQVLFRGETAADTVREIPRKDTRFAKAVRSMDRHGRKAAARQGMLRLRSHPWATVLAVAALVLSAAGFVMVVTADGQDRFVPLMITLAAIMGTLFIGRDLVRPEPTLTERGWAARDQLRSVRAHLRRQLRKERRAGNAPGAEPVTEDGESVLQVYERLLPYAMVFGVATKWSRLLATRYETDDVAVTWMTGRAGHTAFLGHWQYVNSTVRKSGTYVAPSSSSSSSGGGGFSGGSSGGGFSGGGGGGGFSGGR